jgi:hypothetical protein
MLFFQWTSQQCYHVVYLSRLGRSAIRRIVIGNEQYLSDLYVSVMVIWVREVKGG